jgi:uncharacterized protein
MRQYDGLILPMSFPIMTCLSDRIAMKALRIQDIPVTGLVLSCDAPPGDFHPDGLTLSESVQIQLDALRHPGKEILLHFSVRAQVTETCGRCLISFPEVVCADFSVHCIPQSASPSEAPQALSEEDLDIHFYSGDTIGIHELVASQIHLSLASYPRCREDCRGLCPRCGENLNHGLCGCPGETETMLLQLKEKHAQSKA